ncbi:vacuolar protein sorting-associated protein 13D-like [Elysia marginata]|uniref:Vacuolar protein sorting-associated protein 13D-like n=1 Tax=Elysia marginata TaxID=1093978 RepID=A0AAV4FH44_9GAST|nr:vacuolar protein sorting-associated protein 13D-like [Elysia marginata]
MLEGLAAWVLNTYVGEYVENLNTAQLSIALLQGAVELENLPLKKDALKSLDIPIEVKSGFIGKITLQIPLRRLRSEPWVISIEKLYLVAGPLTNLQYDEGKEKQTEQEQKQAMLDALEAKWKVFQGVQADAASSSSWFSYGASMATNILENIQLKVKDVHLRYEDDKMNPACPFACGAIIKNLSVQSTNSSWTPTFVSHQETDKMFKLVDLTDFGVYCDANVTMMGDLSHSDLSDHEYILRPITAQGKVTRNTSALPLRSASTPRISLELTLSDMSVMLATDQYQSLNLWQREFSRHGRRRKFRQGRPACSVLSR